MATRASAQVGTGRGRLGAALGGQLGVEVRRTGGAATTVWVWAKSAT